MRVMKCICHRCHLKRSRKKNGMPIHPLNLMIVRHNGIEADCICHRCIRENDLRSMVGWALSLSVMVLCPDCGNKRCPRAEDHRFECTGSNEPGQVGIVSVQFKGETK